MHNTRLILQTEKSRFQHVPRRKSWPLQLPATISASLLRLGYGAANFWTSPAVPHLTSSHSKFTVTPDEGSWIVSLMTFGGIIGFLLYPLFTNRIGRKYTMLLFTILQVFSWIVIYYASNVQQLYVARTLAGIGYNAGFIVEIIYVGEISEKKIRGFLVILGKISYSLGYLIVVILGAFVSYDNMDLILLLISLLFVVTFPFMPESPYFYLKINNEEAAFESLSKFRGSKDLRALQLEIDSMKEGIIKHELLKTYSQIKLFTIAKNRRALLIGLLANFTVTLSASGTVAAYAQSIVSHYDTSLKPEHTTVLIILVVLISSIILAPLPDCVGRKILALSFGILVAASGATIGAFSLHKHYLNEDLSWISWIPLVALMAYLVATSTGLFTLSTVIVAEIFSLEIKSSAIAIINIVSAILEFLLKLGFERLLSVVKIYGAFWIFGACSFVTTLISFIIMPETKGKTLEEIQKALAEIN